MSAAPAIQGTNEVVAAGRAVAVGVLIERASGRLGASAHSSPLAIVGGSAIDLIGWAGWLASTKHEGLVLPRERLTSSVSELLDQSGFERIDADSGAVERKGRGEVTRARVHLVTSGTTGEPKLIQHSWASLYTMARVRSAKPVRWLMTYQPGTYAWYQIVTALLFSPGHSVVVSDEATPAGMLAAAAASNVTAISATPTFWRVGLLQSDAADIDRLRSTLERITLGGEPVDQAILDMLHERFPAARLVHIYASTEAGASIVVGDGEAGFPAAWLNDETRAVRVKVEDGRLWLRSPHAAAGFEGWIDTRDLASVRDDRVHLLGRMDHSFINVGGAKALAADIERVLMAHPYVLWCRVRGRRAPLVGQLVVASIVPQPGRTNEPVPEEELTAYCADRMSPHMVPRIWERLEAIPTGANWKTEV